MHDNTHRAERAALWRGVTAVLAVGLLLLAATAHAEAHVEARTEAHVGVDGYAGSAGSSVLRLTLDEAIMIALDHGREIGIAEASEAAARTRVGQTRSAFLPAVSAVASYTRLDEVPYMDASGFSSMFDPLMEPFGYLVEEGYLDPATLEGLSGDGESGRIPMGDDDIYSVGVTVTQPLFTGGAILSAHGVAGHGLRAAECNTRRTEHETRYNVTEAYVLLVQTDAALAVTDDAVAQMQSHLDDLEAMFEVGMLLERDIMQARVQMSEIELSRNAARHGVRLARAALAFRLGVEPGTRVEALDALDRPDRTKGDFGKGELDDLVLTALTERPDLKSMTENVGAADNAVGIARAEFFPQIVATGTYSWDRPNREYEPEFYDHWSVTIAARMNVFDWGGRWNRVGEAKALRLQAERGLDLMESAIRLEVEQSWLEHDEALEAVDIAGRGVAQARESFRVTQESFRSGIASNSEVLDASTALRTAEMNRIRALARLRLAEAGLDLVAGIVSDREETR